MVHLKISLPEELELLHPDTIAAILREEIRRRTCDYLLSIADKLAAAGVTPMTAEEVQEEIRAARRG
jgi:hypothetical protein